MKQWSGEELISAQQRDRDVANLLPPVVASESPGVWSATPVHRGHNSSDDSLQLMALSRALNPSSLIGSHLASG